MARCFFISKTSSEVAKLQHFLDQNNTILKSESFLHFEALNHRIDHNYQVIFFGSTRAVKYFADWHEVAPNTSFACVGNKTAELLESMGHKVSYNGTGANSITTIASDFKKWCGQRKVLFPISDISLRTISSQLDPDQVQEVKIYSTQIISHQIPECDIYVFTSPSNVKGFFADNTIEKDAYLIAWGESTRDELLSYNLKANHTLSEPSLEELIEHLQESKILE